MKMRRTGQRGTKGCTEHWQWKLSRGRIVNGVLSNAWKSTWDHWCQRQTPRAVYRLCTADHKQHNCHHFQASHSVFDHPYNGLISWVVLKLHCCALRISCYPMAIYYLDAGLLTCDFTDIMQCCPPGVEFPEKLREQSCFSTGMS